MISVSALERGCAVYVPYEMKDIFRSEFYHAIWSPEKKAWIIGPEFEQRLDEWIERVSDVAKELEKAETYRLMTSEWIEQKSLLEELESELNEQAERRGSLGELQKELDDIARKIKFKKTDIFEASEESSLTKLELLESIDGLRDYVLSL